MPHRISKLVTQIKPPATIAVAAKARELTAAGHDIISLGVGEPDFDTPAHIGAAAMEAIRAGQTRYPPVGGTPELKQAIIRKFERDNDLRFGPGQIIVSTGAKQSIFNGLMALLNPGDEVILPAPYWVSYPDMVKMASGKAVILNTRVRDNFKITPRQLASSLTDGSRLLIINSPSNPTGKVYTAAEYRALADVLLEFPKVMVMVDDIYEYIHWADEPFRTFLNACPEMAERMVIVNGVSKAYAMTGWRIGYAAGPETVIHAMAKVQAQCTSGACSISQAAAAAALNGPQDCVAEMRREYKQRYEYLLAALNELDGVTCEPCDGAFYALPSFEAVIERMPGIRDDVELAAWMLENAGVAMVPGTPFGAPGHMRLSYATSLENLEESLRRISAAITPPKTDS